MKKIVSLILVTSLVVALFTGCSSNTVADHPAIGKTFLHYEEDEVQFKNFNKQADLKPLSELSGLSLTVG